MAFASTADVQTRLGRDLTEAESDQAGGVIATVTGLIVDAADKTAEWAEALDPVPETLKALCVEKAIGAITNPTSLAQESEGLGSYQHARTFPRSSDSGVFLTDQEERLARSAIFGSSSGSSQPRALPDRLIDLAENRDVDEEA